MKNLLHIDKTLIWLQLNLVTFDRNKYLTNTDKLGFSFVFLLFKKGFYFGDKIKSEINKTFDWLKAIDQKLLNDFVCNRDNDQNNFLQSIYLLRNWRRMDVIVVLIQWLHTNKFEILDFLIHQKNIKGESFIKTLVNMKRENDLTELLNSLEILDELVYEKIKSEIKT